MKMTEMVSVTKELLAMVLEVAENDSVLLEREWDWRDCEEQRQLFSAERELIYELRNFAGIEED